MDLEDYGRRLRSAYSDGSRGFRLLTTRTEGRGGHRVLRAYCHSDGYDARVSVELEDTGLLHLEVDLSEYSIPLYARYDWLKGLIELCPRIWYNEEDVYLLASEEESRGDAIDDIGRKFQGVITDSFDLSFVPKEFNQIAADTKAFMVFARAFKDSFPELDPGTSGDLDHLLRHLDELLEVKMRSDEVYWNYRSTVMVERLTILTVLLAILALATAFVAEYVFSGEVSGRDAGIAVVAVVIVSAASMAMIWRRYRPFGKAAEHSDTITREALAKKAEVTEAAARAGSVADQLEMGRMCEGGFGMPPSIENAKRWYGMASGNADAQFNLAVIHEVEASGSRRETDSRNEEQSPEARASYVEAARHYREAIKMGHVMAHNYLGELYKMGWGVEQSYPEAASWYLKAAEMGDVYAMYNLAGLYLEGNGVEQSYSEAARWLAPAAASGDMDAQYDLALLYRDGRVPGKGHSDALELLLTSADRGNADSAHEAGAFYEKGLGTEASAEKAAEFYRFAEELGWDGSGE